MASAPRFKNIVWHCGTENEKFLQPTSVHHSQLAVLMDIRDELQTLNRIFACPNFTALPRDISKLRSEVSGIRRDLKKRGGGK